MRICDLVYLYAFFPTFAFSVSGQTLDEGEDEEDDEGGHADSSERLRSTCRANRETISKANSYFSCVSYPKAAQINHLHYTGTAFKH